MTGRAVVITCPSCDGLTFTVGACLCVGYGNRILVTDDPAPREPYQECQVCRGVGQVATACHRCGQRGERRAQLVLTVANVDTGEVSSASVVPGTVPPRPAPGGGWHLPLKPLVDELAESVGAATWSDCHGQSGDGSAVLLPREWSPELPDDQRLALEIRAIAGHPGESWQVYLGRSIAPPAVVPERRLGQLCDLADRLCLDLVLEARRLCHGHDDLLWDIRFDVPGAAVPATRRGTAYSLTEALCTVTVSSAISGIAARGLAAPARYLVPSVEPAPDPARPVRDLDQVERRVVSECAELRTGEPLPGACAIWRDGRWWYSSLRVADRTERLVERETGQLLRRRTEVLRRGWEPPDPDWLGDAIAHTPCPACDPGNGLRPCYCTVGATAVDPDCASCGGSGLRAGMLTCHTCLDSHRIFQGMVVTLTDLDHQVVHLNWRAGVAAPAPLVATQPGGKPVVQLPERFRLATHASTFGVRPEDLTEADGGWPVDQDLREGYVTLHVTGVEPLTQHLAQSGRGRPGGRLIVLAAPPEVPPLPHLIRLAPGLGLAVDVSVRDNRHNADDPLHVQGVCWYVEFTVAPTPTTPEAEPAGRPTLAGAIAYGLDYLGSVLAEAVPDDPAQPIAVPQAPMSDPIADPEPMLRRLGAHRAGQWVTVRFSGADCRIGVREQGTLRHLVSAADLTTGLTALGLGAG
ncbi:hypothetical protein [Plantactinospora sp. BB1]|uniref:hypothetical protein n=1 Tax=Plantactinospora sp. BB1 TaxID=2071627 RepID=UPI00131F3D84|nr:hypothetical protein [Plantactinospora sp. BB1]